MIKLTLENIVDKIQNSKSLASITKSINLNIEFYNYIVIKTSFLPNDATLKQRLYHIKNDLYQIEKCEICLENNKKWNEKYSKYNNYCKDRICINEYVKNSIDQTLRVEKIKNTKIEKYGEDFNKILNKKNKLTCLEKYGVDHYTKTDEYKIKMKEKFGYVSPFELKETHDKSKETLIEKYGVDHNMKIDAVKEKRVNTFIEKYGFNTPTKNDDIKQKIKNTNIEKYGFVSPMCNLDIQEKSKNTLFKNYGVEYTLQSKEIYEKMLKTMKEKYGYEYWIQDDSNFEKLLKSKSKNTYYEYILPNDEKVFLQGYENVILFKLLTLYDIKDILIRNEDITNCIGIIFYEFEGNKHKYYPDFYIKSKNMIVEVKSDYTFEIDYDKNIAKQKACIEQNLNFEFVILSKKEYKKQSKEYGIKKSKN